ncbi:helix-turn-helix domain-containing protein [Streptomyces griseochromogenes]|uniref:helix-turn-helix domain-containing protein n=1 Tax=Streptomyces griseochromogenes TaxID=68214 RepID=UPI0009A09B04|nr:helix-turn-helix domain-containing protein [Streptomyces griseochromogenes]
MRRAAPRLHWRPDPARRQPAPALCRPGCRPLHGAFTASGASVMEHVRRRRLERARADLLSTTWTVSEIAARRHFTDSSHFIRACRKRYGETPTASRRSQQAVAHYTPPNGPVSRPAESRLDGCDAAPVYRETARRSPPQEPCRS